MEVVVIHIPREAIATNVKTVFFVDHAVPAYRVLSTCP